MHCPMDARTRSTRTKSPGLDRFEDFIQIAGKAEIPYRILPEAANISTPTTKLKSGPFTVLMAVFPSIVIPTLLSGRFHNS